jgi:hypothetical protein
MGIELRDVEGVVSAFVSVLERMSQKERQDKPNMQYGERFNEVLALSKEALPQIDQRLWPKPVEFITPQFGAAITVASYAEIETYARQILSIVVR